MNAKELYSIIDKDFDIENLKDDWSFMDLNEYVSPNFKKRYMGIVLDNSHEINKVYTATMPDTEIIEKLITSNEKDVLLFSHHAMGYDPTMEGFPFYNILANHLWQLQKQRISFYVLHVPLDKNGSYSTSVCLAKNLNLEIIDEFCKYDGIKCGVICKTSMNNINELANHVRTTVGHEIKVLRNGDEKVINGKIAIAAGGGSVDFAVKEIADLGINTYITGNTRELPAVSSVVGFHRIIKEKKINVIGATHYSTEKYACIAMIDYFKKLGLHAEFIEGKYYLEDL